LEEVTAKKLSSLLVLSRKKALTIFSTILLVYSYTAQAWSTTADHSNTGLESRRNSKQDDWIQFPYTVQVSPYIGATQKIPGLLAPDDTQKTRQHLGEKGVGIDIGVLQLRRSIYEYFHFYPKLGIAFNCSWLENKGSFLGGSIYLEPQYNHLAKWEIFPRLSLGIIYANIPSTNFKDLPANEGDDSTTLPDTGYAQDFYRQGLHWDLSLALVTKINITPYWQLSPSIGLSYLSPFGKEHKEHQKALEDTSLNSYILSVALGYTPNPSLISYSSEKHDKSSRISIGWLSAFKEFNSSALGIHAHELSDHPMEGDGKYYYVGGIYGQWSVPVHGNHALTLATEWIMDGVTEQARKDMINSSSLKISFLGGHEFRWGKILFGQQLGFYVMNSDGIQASLEEIYFYTRLGLDYKITNFLTLGTSLKTNVLLTRKQENFIQMDTDFIDFRISYSF